MFEDHTLPFRLPTPLFNAGIQCYTIIVHLKISCLGEQYFSDVITSYCRSIKQAGSIQTSSFHKTSYNPPDYMDNPRTI